MNGTELGSEISKAIDKLLEDQDPRLDQIYDEWATKAEIERDLFLELEKSLSELENSADVWDAISVTLDVWSCNE